MNSNNNDTVATTERQQEILEKVVWYYLNYDRIPPTRWLQHEFGFASQTAVVTHLRALEKKGYIETIEPDDRQHFYRFSRSWENRPSPN